jgi:phage terminase large subunit-like protein
LAGAWLDEIAKWRYAKAIWTEGILLSLRAPLVGGRPRAIVTSTPKPIPLLKEWDKRWRDGDHFIHITSGSTFENVDNLSAEIVAEFKNEYEGTSLGRQELYGQLLQEVDGALWTQANIDNNRIKPSALPDLSMTIVGVDPSGTGQGDEMGLVAAGQGVDGNHYVLADWSVKMAGRPAARRVWQLFEEVNADLVIYEDNLGKEWLRTVLQDAYKEFQNEGVFPPGGIAPMRPVTAVKGKKLRAQPTAMRYEQNRVKHVGEFVELEAQMTSWVPEEQIDSPDRVDALVHAQAYLRQRERGRATIAVPKGFRAS